MRHVAFWCWNSGRLWYLVEPWYMGHIYCLAFLHRTVGNQRPNIKRRSRNGMEFHIRYRTQTKQHPEIHTAKCIQDRYCRYEVAWWATLAQSVNWLAVGWATGLYLRKGRVLFCLSLRTDCLWVSPRCFKPTGWFQVQIVRLLFEK
jgi:hypothetical protein